MCRPARSFRHLLCRLHGRELTTEDEEIEELRMRFQSAMLDALHQLFQLGTFCLRQQRDGRALDRSIANLNDLRVRQIGNQPDPLRRINLKMTSKPAGKVEDVEVIEANA